MKQFILYSWIVVLMVVLVGCSQDDADAVDSAQTPIEFTADSPARFITRGVIENNSQLQSAGFGVLAYYTGSYTWDLCDGSVAEGHTNPVAPNFMYNQQVTWNNTNSNWTYSPVKYWPNDNNSADGSGAEGSQTNSYVSFFAYAPYNGTGIALSNNTTTGAPTINYTWGAENDLLYASQLDCYKTMTSPGSYGTVGGQVPFNFQHALAQVKFKVRRSSGSALVIKVKSLTVSGFYTSGTFNWGDVTPTWSSTSGSGNKTFDPDPDMNVTADTEGDAQLIGSSLMIPATSTPPATVLSYTINYSVGPQENSKTDDIPLTSYEMGYQYTIIFTIDADGIIVDTEKYTEQW